MGTVSTSCEALSDSKPGCSNFVEMSERDLNACFFFLAHCSVRPNSIIDSRLRFGCEMNPSFVLIHKAYPDKATGRRPPVALSRALQCGDEANCPATRWVELCFSWMWCVSAFRRVLARFEALTAIGYPPTSQLEKLYY